MVQKVELTEDAIEQIADAVVRKLRNDATEKCGATPKDSSQRETKPNGAKKKKKKVNK